MTNNSPVRLSSRKRCWFSHLIPTALTQSADLQVIWSYYFYLKWNMENTCSLWQRKSLVFGSPWLIDNDPQSSTASSCHSSQWCQPKCVA